MIFFKLTFISLLLAVFYIIFGYDLERTNFIKLVTLYGTLFSLSYFLWKLKKQQLIFLASVGVLFRLLFLVAIPNLSPDFYRFIWDGTLVLEGINPYVHLPKDLMSASSSFSIPQAEILFNGMTDLSANHYSNYPPLNQSFFALSRLLGGESILGAVIAMRILLILADVGILYIGRKLLKSLGLSQYYIFFYFLNPFIITELTGNLHFEGVMLFFLIWGLYLLHMGKWKASAVVLALSISVKLLPVMFLPLFFQKLGRKRCLWYYSIVGVVTVLLVLPFYNEAFLTNYSETIGLWFTHFEFNASVYNIIQGVNGFFNGTYRVGVFKIMLPVLVLIFVIGLSFFRKNRNTIDLLTSMLLVLSVYFFTTSTVHPWYIATLVLLSVFTRFRFPLVWSLVIILSYEMYGNADFKENLWVIGLEYVIVYGFLFFELFKKDKNLKFQV